MRKALALFLIMISFGIVFAGAVSAAQDVEVAVINEDGTPVDETTPGDEVAVQVNASANGTPVTEPWVAITVDPETGLVFLPEDAVMMFNGVPYFNDDPIMGGFFFWYEDGQVWAWDIGWISDMDGNDEAMLIAPAIVNDVGEITVNADFFELYPIEDQEPILLDSDSFTFLSVAGETVPMQDTGAPVALAALGLLGIIGGAVYGRLR